MLQLQSHQFLIARSTTSQVNLRNHDRALGSALPLATARCLCSYYVHYINGAPADVVKPWQIAFDTTVVTRLYY